jgi:GTP-binding protein
MAVLVRESRAEEPEANSEFVIHRPAPEGITIERGDDGSFIVVGRAAERAVALNDLTNVEAADYVRQRLTKLGVNKALAKAGARDGDTVVVGQLVFDFEED